MAPIDEFAQPQKLESPAYSAVPVTPDDSNDLTYLTRGVYIGGTGNLAVIMAGGQTVTFNGAVAGTILPIAVKRVLASGTTATGVVAIR